MIIENCSVFGMFASVTILDQYVDSEETIKFTPGAQLDAINFAT